MGDKWTTSGGWRLKAKQNRSFAARGSHHNRHHGSTVIIDITKNQSSHSTGNLNSALYRPRNAGAKGSYSEYADPIARRAVVVSFLRQSNSEHAPNHPIHPTRRIRDPNQQDTAMKANSAYNFREFVHQRDTKHPTIAQGLINLPLQASLPLQAPIAHFHGNFVSPSFAGTNAHPTPSYNEQPMHFCQPEEPHLAYLHDDMDPNQGYPIEPKFQNTYDMNSSFESVTSRGLARFQHQPQRFRYNGTPGSGSFLPPRYQSNPWGEQESRNQPFSDFFVFPTQMNNRNSNSSFGQSQEIFHNSFHQSQPHSSTMFYVPSPPRVMSSIAPDLSREFHDDLDPDFGKVLTLSRHINEQGPNSGIPRFQTNQYPSNNKRFDYSFGMHDLERIKNTSADDYDCASNTLGNQEIQKQLKVKRSVPDDALQVEIPTRQLTGTKSNKSGGNKPSESLNKVAQGKTATYPWVRHRKTCQMKQKIRFFNEGIEVDFANRPLSQANSCDSTLSSKNSQGSSRQNPSESDDDLDLAGMTSMWGDRKL